MNQNITRIFEMPAGGQTNKQNIYMQLFISSCTQSAQAHETKNNKMQTQPKVRQQCMPKPK